MGQDLSNDTQMRIIGSEEPGIRTKMLAEKFPATTRTTPWLKLPTGLNDAFSEIFELEASSVQSQSLLQKDRKRKKGEKKEKELVTFSCRNFIFRACPSKNVLKRCTRGKKGMSSCYKCFCE